MDTPRLRLPSRQGRVWQRRQITCFFAYNSNARLLSSYQCQFCIVIFRFSSDFHDPSFLPF
jgi:hypothetical protein